MAGSRGSKDAFGILSLCFPPSVSASVPGGLSLYGGKDTTDIYRLLCYQPPHEQEGAFFYITCSSAQDLLPKLSQWHSNGLCMFVCTDFCALVSTVENHTFPLIPRFPSSSTGLVLGLSSLSPYVLPSLTVRPGPHFLHVLLVCSVPHG